MKTVLAAIAVAMVFASTTGALAQSPDQTPVGAVPPAAVGGHSGSSAQALKPAGSQNSTTKIEPGPAYSHGAANFGNSSESNGMPGSEAARGSATMQSGHTAGTSQH